LRPAARGDGIDPARLVFMPKLPHAEYLTRYRHADLFLDTHPTLMQRIAMAEAWKKRQAPPHG
jgi:Zn-dependent protease with chaperone function